MSQYTVKLPDEQFCGPIPLATLVEWARDNRIGPDFWIWNHTTHEWTQAATIPAVAEAIPARTRHLKFPKAPPPLQGDVPPVNPVANDPLSRAEAAVSKEIEQSRKAAPLGQQRARLRLKSRDAGPSDPEPRKKSGITQALKKMLPFLPPVLPSSDDEEKD